MNTKPRTPTLRLRRFNTVPVGGGGGMEPAVTYIGVVPCEPDLRWPSTEQNTSAYHDECAKKTYIGA